MAASSGDGQRNPEEAARLLFFLHLPLFHVVTYLLDDLLAFLVLPRIIAEIIGGILVAMALGRGSAGERTAMGSLADVGIFFYVFLEGMQLDVRALCRAGDKALAIALAGVSIPFILGAATSFALRPAVAPGVSHGPRLLFVGAAFSITSATVVAQMLADLRLLAGAMGRLAVSAAALSDAAAWVLLAVAATLSDSRPLLVSLGMLLAGAVFAGFAALAVPRGLGYISRRSPGGEQARVYALLLLTAVLAVGFVVDSLGIHPLLGALVMGLGVPEGQLAGSITEELEKMISFIFLPAFFISVGHNINLGSISGLRMLLVFVTAFLGKFASAALVSLRLRLPAREAAALGFLMNGRGLVGLAFLIVGKDCKVLSDETFGILVLTVLFTTVVPAPAAMIAMAGPCRKAASYEHRTIARSDAESELRILACFRSSESIPAIMKLVGCARGTPRRAGVSLYAMELIEFSNRLSPVSMMRKARCNWLPFWNRDPSGDVVVASGEACPRLSSISVYSMRVLSDIDRLHRYIISGAEEKQVALIVIPFWKKELSGSEPVADSFDWINYQVLRIGPCSVGVLVDRGLGRTAATLSVVVLFFGGRDDREALAYATCISRHPHVALRVLRFSVPPWKEPELDQACLADFRAYADSTAGNISVAYEEKEARREADISAAVKAVRSCNLFLVGRRSPGECRLPEMPPAEYDNLGPLGGYLAMSQSTSSVLVIQNHVRE